MTCSLHVYLSSGIQWKISERGRSKRDVGIALTVPDVVAQAGLESFRSTLLVHLTFSVL